MGCFVRAGKNGMGCYVRGDKNSMGCYVQGDKNSMGYFVQGGKSLWDVWSGVSKNGLGCFVPGCFVRLPDFTDNLEFEEQEKNTSEQYDNPADMSLQMHKHSHSFQSKQIARKNAIKLSPLQMRKHSHSLQSKQIARKNTNKLSSLQMRKRSHSLQSKQIARNNANKVSSLQMRKQSHSPFRANTLLERMPINCLHYKYANNPTPFSTHVQILTYYTFNIFRT